MVGLALVAHGHLAQELVETARLIVGDFPVTTSSVMPGSSPEEIRALIHGAIAQANEGQGVLVLADLVGGTPCTQSLALCQSADIEVITGMNLPMLLKAQALRASPGSLRELAQQVVAYGQRNITCATQALRSALPTQH